tara:strand:+ start:374 stop:793 length:420 start_codon:yes stop_codon:yes gene_type:complete
MGYKNIMVALSGKGDETPVIDEVARLKNSFNAKLIAVHVNDPHAGKMSMMMDSVGHDFTEEEIRDLFRNAGHEEIAKRMEVQILTGKLVHKEISKAAQSIDLLILGHRKINRFKDQFFDSEDEGIINTVNCPVLVVPKP